jgi:hypothetical protein
VLNELDTDRSEHPVDVVEQIAALRQWTFERAAEDEISITVAGLWSDYHASFTWVEEMEALHLSCAFDLKVPEARRAEAVQLIALINEQLWVGHFDLWSGESSVMFRHALLLAGNGSASAEQCEALLKIAVTACERYYQAFQFVLWAGKPAREALASVLFETVGQA